MFIKCIIYTTYDVLCASDNIVILVSEILC